MAMDEKERHSAFISALVTEHFVMQTAAIGNVSEAGARASLYMFTLSSALVAMGFASGSRDVFVPFVATVLPAVFLLGAFTAIRLVDSAIEYNLFLTEIARIRGYYRTLTPEAAVYFSSESGQWPEVWATPAKRLGAPIASTTTNASMVAFVNSIVAGAGIALLAGDRLGNRQTGLSVALGVVTAIALMAAFVAYQNWRRRDLLRLSGTIGARRQPRTKGLP
jgi:hypothetical protein